MATVTLSTGTKKTGKFLRGYDNTHIYSRSNGQWYINSGLDSEFWQFLI